MESQILEYFQSLKLENWSTTGNFGHGGQADIVEVKNKITGELGIFRTLRRKNPQDILRFYRELQILTKTNHPNIVQILDYTKDDKHQWYISKKGDRFEKQWDHFLKANYDKPDLILERAIEILGGLTDGLSYLHKKGVIHRDIKAKNIVFYHSTPVLIDFGIAFVTGEERFTPVDEAVGNIYSPDPSLNFMVNVPPWLDIFLLSQLLIWMVSEGTSKPHTQRPLDWRWVVYPELSKINTLKVRALTAICSNFFTAPKDAGEFKILLNNLFEPMKSNDQNSDSNKIQEALEIIQMGKSNELIKFSDARSLIESRLPKFSLSCKMLEQGLSSLVLELAQFNIVANDNQFVETFNKLFSDRSDKELNPMYQTVFNYNVGEGQNTFSFGFSYILYTRKGVEASPQFKWMENIPVIAFTLNGSETLNKKGITKSYYLTPDDNGGFKLNDANSLLLIKQITIIEVIDMVRRSIVDPEIWRAVYSS